VSRDVVFVGGSPSATSRSAFVAQALASELQRAGLRPVFWSLQDFEPADVFFGRADAPAVARFVQATKEAVAVVLSTPVYKAAYTGILKAIVDLIPPDALIGRPALGVATARLAAHGTEVDRAMRALFAFFQARALETLVLFDDELKTAKTAGAGMALPSAIEQRVRNTARALVSAVEEGPVPRP
jgi:FMN reductase